MNSQPIVSICCLTYNHEKYIKDALNGFLKQKTKYDYEIIIHDDASSDATSEIIRDYKNKYPEIINLIQQKENQYSKGIPPSPTFVWPKARGKYIALCEGDDYWTDPLKLQKQIDFLEKNPTYSGCYHNAIKKFENPNIPDHPFWANDQNKNVQLTDILKENIIPTASLVFRSKIISKLPDWYSKTKMGDWVLHIINLEQADYYYMNAVMSVYRIHSNGMWTSVLSEETKIRSILEFYGYVNKYLDYKYNDLIVRLCEVQKELLSKTNKQIVKVELTSKSDESRKLSKPKKKAGPKIVHLCTQDNGGAGNAAYYINKGLEKLGVDSKLIVLNKTKDDPVVEAIPDDYHITGQLKKELYASGKNQAMWQRFWEVMNSFPQRPKGIEIFTTPESNIDISAINEIKEADIINLHWVAGMINIDHTNELFKDKKIVWTLHDMNTFTGGCHYSGDCSKYINSCGRCPQLGSNLPEDLSNVIWNMKKSFYENFEMTVVTPSKWLAIEAKKSALLKKFTTKVIPNAFDLSIFTPQDDSGNKTKVGIPKEAKVILFGAAYNNKRKGFEYLVDTLKKNISNQQKENIYLGVFGEIGDFEKVLYGYNIIKFGSVENPLDLAKIYSLADVFVIPSLEDNLPLVVVEALACGTPVVGFNIGGIPDMIDHKSNGYIAKAMNSIDLANGIRWCLKQDKKTISQIARDKAISEFELTISAGKYLSLYKELLVDSNKNEAFGTNSLLNSKVSSESNLISRATTEEYQYLVSAIVSTYNSVEFIQGCLEDLVNQSLYKSGDLEIVVVNSGSKQNEDEIITQYVKTYKNIKYIKTDQRETVYQAWNRAIKAASGKYITNSNTDDRHHPDALKQLCGELETNSTIDLVYHDTILTKNPNEKFHSATIAGHFYWPEYSLKRLFEICYIGPHPMWRKSLHNEYGYFDENYISAGDYEFWLRIAKESNIKHIPKLLGLYLEHDQSIEHKNQNTSFIESEKARQKHWKGLGICPKPNGTYLFPVSEINPNIKNSLVSVIIPTFNRPELLKNAIDSVLQQIHQNFEIIVINDHGTDIGKFINSYNDERIKYYNNTNVKGPSATRNIGLENASGKYICFLDDDDIFYPDHLQVLVSAIEKSDEKIVYSDANKAEQKIRAGKSYITQREVEFSKEFSKQELLLLNVAPTQCFLFEKKCFEDVGYFDTSLPVHEDWELWIRLSRKYNFLHIPKVTSEYRRRVDQSNLTTTKHHDFASTYEIVTKRFLKESKEIPGMLESQARVLQSLKQKVLDHRVSIVIPLFNKVELTKNCIASIKENTDYDNYEIIIVDNASTDGTKDYLKAVEKEKNIDVIYNKTNIGFAKANNVGAQLATGAFILCLNNDIVVKNGWLKPLVSLLANDEDIGAAGSKLLFPDGTVQHAGVVIINDKKLPDPLVARHIYWKQSPDNPEVNTRKTFQALTAACLLIRKSVFDKIDGFDEEYWNGYEDVDLCFKIREAGYKLVFEPESELIHYESQSGKERFTKVSDNINRLHQKWTEKVKPDFIMEKDGTMLKTDAGVIKPYFFKKDDSLRSAENKVSIVIPTFNQWKYTKQTLDSISEFTEMDYEIIIVDNASTDETVEQLKLYKNLKIVANDINHGFPKAVNQGILEASGNYVLIANNDIVITEGSVERMVEIAESDKKIGIVGPISNSVSGVQIDKEAKYKSIPEMHNYAQKIREKNKSKIMDFPRVAFLCTLIKRDVINSIGGLDERFSPGNYEDDDFCLRAQLAGYKTVIAEDVFIHHFGSKSFIKDGNDKYLELLEVNKTKFIDKWGADPNDIWLKGVKPKSGDIVYPLNENNFTKSFQRATKNISEKDFISASTNLKVAIENYDQSANEELIEYSSLINLAGNVALINGDYPLAREYFEEELNLKPDSSTACSGLAEVSFVEENYEESKTMYEWAVKNDMQNEAALNGLKKVNILLQLPEDDNSLYGESDYSPLDNADAIIKNARKHFESKNFDEALTLVKQAEELMQDDSLKEQKEALFVSLNNFKGYCYIGLNKLDEAKSCFESVLQIEPNSSDSCAGLGEVIYLSGNDEEAKTMFEWAVKVEPENIFALEGLKKVNKNLGFEETHNSLLIIN